MRTEDDLPPRSSRDAVQQLREMADHLGMQREFRLFQEDWSGAVLEHPEQAEQAQRAVREL